MRKLKISEAIEAFNETRRVNQDKMTQKLLAEKAMPDKELGNAINYISRLSKGHINKIDVDSLLAISEVLECDPNFLTGYTG